MSVDSWIALFSAIGICAGTVFVGFQLKIANEQQKLANDQQKIANEQVKTKSVLKYYDITRELITLGFTVPELFQILQGGEADPVVERRYLQLWFNQFAAIHRFQQKEVFPAADLESFKRDIRASMMLANMQNHWDKNRKYYSDDFQLFIDQFLPLEKGKKADALSERPPQEAGPLTDS